LSFAVSAAHAGKRKMHLHPNALSTASSNSDRPVIAKVEDMNATWTIENRERARLETLDLVTKQMAVAVTCCSCDFRYLWANQAYADWLRCPLEEVIGRHMSEVLGKTAFEALLPHFNRVLTGQNVHYEQEAFLRGLGRRWISARYTPTFGEDGAVVGWGGGARRDRLETGRTGRQGQ